MFTHKVPVVLHSANITCMCANTLLYKNTVESLSPTVQSCGWNSGRETVLKAK